MVLRNMSELGAIALAAYGYDGAVILETHQFNFSSKYFLNEFGNWQSVKYAVGK